MSRPVYEYSQKIVDTRGTIRKRVDPDGQVSRDGFVVTPFGFVIVDSYSSNPAYPHVEPVTYFRFMWRGREHFRSEPGSHTGRGLAIMAGRFARRIARRSR